TGRLGPPPPGPDRTPPAASEGPRDGPRPEPAPPPGDLVHRPGRVEPSQVRPTHLDQVRQADPALEPVTVPVCVSDQLRPDVGVETDEPGAVLPPHALLQRGR